MWTRLLMAEGSLLVQLIFLFVEVSGIGYLAWRLSRAQREAARVAHEMVERTAHERAAAILEVQRTADQLAERTAEIAETLKREAIAAAGTHVADMEHKIDELVSQFDAVGKQQVAMQELQDSVKETSDILHRELAQSSVTNKTTRDQIDDIQTTTDETNKRLKEKDR